LGRHSIAHSIFKSVAHLRAAFLTLEQRCIAGITANRNVLRAYVENSIGLVTALNPYIGYANATAIAVEAHATGRGVYELVLEKKLLPEATLAKILRPETLTMPQGITLE
jgi:aspartate ammonia-lyase